MVIYDNGEGRYIRRIKSPPKREFALAYLDWLKKGGMEPERPQKSFRNGSASRTD